MKIEVMNLAEAGTRFNTTLARHLAQGWEVIGIGHGGVTRVTKENIYWCVLKRETEI
jgi:hypothetical protein